MGAVTKSIAEPIVVSRSGKPISVPEISPGEKGAFWASIVRDHARRHPEIFQKGGGADALDDPE